MTKKRAIILTLAAVLAVLLFVYFWGPASPPAGQKPLTELSDANFREFASAFDQNPDAPRLVLLLSPT